MRLISARFRRAVHVKWLQLWMRASVRQQIAGFEVFLVGEEDQKSDYLLKLEEALALIARVDPPRFARLQQDLQYFLIYGPGTFRGSYVHELGMCRLDDEYVRAASTSPADLALTIVHEAAHARLEHAGVRYSDAHRIRIERGCIAAQIAFARKLSASAALVERLRDQHRRAEEVWSPAAARAHSIAALRRLGCPEWLVRWHAWRTRRDSAV